MELVHANARCAHVSSRLHILAPESVPIASPQPDAAEEARLRQIQANIKAYQEKLFQQHAYQLYHYIPPVAVKGTWERDYSFKYPNTTVVHLRDWTHVIVTLQEDMLFHLSVVWYNLARPVGWQEGKGELTR